MFEAADPAERIRAIVALMKLPESEERQRHVPRLVDRLDDEDEAVRFFAIGALERLTGQRLGFRPFDEPGVRREAVDRWRRFVSGGEAVARTGRPGSG